MVVTPEVVEDWRLACEEFESVGEEDAYTLEEVQASWPGLSQVSACSWAIYGLVLQDELTLEMYFSELATYVEKLRARNQFLIDVINSQQAIMDKQKEIIWGG